MNKTKGCLIANFATVPGRLILDKKIAWPRAQISWKNLFTT
uniref:Uncharacterized protein n=1 Tax=Klebsiella pneumoniae TaxID=573 RepID=A0A175D171_KLEPN|nr:hypothetical protein [Klebsiella pneumoniae]